MEDLYVKSAMAHAMDKKIFELQNYFKGNRSKISFDLTMGRTLLSIKRQEMFSNVRSCTCFFKKKKITKSLKFLLRIDFFTKFEVTIIYQRTQVGHSIYKEVCWGLGLKNTRWCALATDVCVRLPQTSKAAVWPRYSDRAIATLWFHISSMAVIV